MLPWDTLAQMSPPVIGWVLLAGAVLMVLTGRLVPRALYLEQKEATESFRKAYEAERDKNEKVLLPLAELTRDVLRSIPPTDTKSVVRRLPDRIDSTVTKGVS